MAKDQSLQDKIDDVPFQEMLASERASKDGNHLGKAGDVNLLLSLYVSRFIDGVPPDFLSTRLARILLGRDKNFVPVRRWNEPGGIDEFLKPIVNSTETGPVSIVKHAVIKLFLEIAEIAEAAQKDSLLPEQYEPAINETILRHARLFVGISPAEQELMLSPNAIYALTEQKIDEQEE